jgi:hypothetical protein
MAIQVTAPEGTGGGVAFGAATDDNVAGASLVRFTDGGRSLEWGVLDAQQTFQSQGSVSLGGISGASHLLELGVTTSDYSILVDGKAVATALAAPPTGWIEFTSLGGPVTFANFKLSLTAIAS